MAWISLDDEANLVDELVATGRVAVTVLGQSVQDRPVRLLRVGAPPPSDSDRVPLFMVGAQHGNEPAGREGLLQFAQYLASVQAVDVRMRLPGGSGDEASTPDHADLDVAGDIDIRADITPDDWNASSYVVSKYDISTDDRSYALRIRGTRQLGLNWSADGSGFADVVSTASIPEYAGRLSVRVTLDADDGDGGRVITFYTGPSVDGPWEALGDPIVEPSTTSLFAGNADLVIGGRGDGTNQFAGAVHRVQIRDGIGGTIVTDPDFTEQAVGAPSFADSTGKTWTLHNNAELVDEGDPDTADFLDGHGVLIIPTANPDGIEADSRLNANGEDINRHHLSLSQPEARAIGEAMGRAQPLMAIDHHESTASTEIEFAQPRLAATQADIVQMSWDLIDQMKARAATEGWTTGDYGDPDGAGDERVFVANAGIRNSCAVLIETSRQDDTPAGQVQRTAWQYAMAEEALAYCIANQATFRDDVDAAAAEKIAEGVAGDEPFDLRVTILDPPPLGYRLLGVLPELHLAAFNVDVGDGAIASMGQWAQPVLPFLFDEDAEWRVANAHRIFTPGPPPIFASVVEFAEVVRGSHHPVFLARVLDTYQTGEDPYGVDIPIVGGDVQLDATADVLASLDLQTAGIDEATGKSIFPRRTNDLLAPYGNEVFVRRGVDLGDRIYWSPLGYFRIDTVEQPGSSGADIRISGQDRMSGIIDADAVIPYFFRGSTTVGEFISRLVTDVYPDAVITYDDDTYLDTLGSSIIVEQSRHEALVDVVESRGKVMFWDGAGILRIEDAPDPDEVVWHIKSGHDGVLVESGRRISREGMHNAVLARGEGAAQRAVKGLAVDIGVNSPTNYVSGRFGRVPFFLTSPLIKTDSMAQRAAEAKLSRLIGMPYSASFGSIVNPALRPRDVVRVTQKDGNRELHHIETLSIPLSADATMTGSTKEKTRLAIGPIPVGELVV